MNVRGLLGNYLEPQWSLDAAQRREVHRIAHRKYLSRTTLFGLTAVWLVAILVSLKLFQSALGVSLAMFGLGRVAAEFLSHAFIVVPLIVAGSWTFRFVYLRPIRRAMRDLGYNVCLKCGYWLKGLDDRTPSCPECGAVLPVAPAEHT